MKTHIVKHGDTLWKIAKHYGVNFETLKKFNKHLTNPDMMLPGQEIQIPLSGNVESVVIDDQHKKVTMKPSSSPADSGIQSLKGMTKEVLIQQQHQKEHVVPQVQMQKEVPITHTMPEQVVHKGVNMPHTMPEPVVHKEVPIPQTMPGQVFHKEVPVQPYVIHKEVPKHKEMPMHKEVPVQPHVIHKEVPKHKEMPMHKEVPVQPHIMHKEMPMPKKVPVHKEHPIQHIHKEYPIHLEPHFDFKLPVQKQTPQQIKNDIHPEVDIHNNYYLTNMQMIEHEHKPQPVPKPVPKPKPLPPIEVHIEPPKQEVLQMPMPIPIVQQECVPICHEECYVDPCWVPICYEEYYVDPCCAPLYGFGLEQEMMMQNMSYQLPQYGLNNYGYMMNPHFMHPGQGWLPNQNMYYQTQQSYTPYMHDKPHHQVQQSNVPMIQPDVVHPYYQQPSVPVMGKQCGCGGQSHHGNPPMQMY